jgi:hypothetical protein
MEVGVGNQVPTEHVDSYIPVGWGVIYRNSERASSKRSVKAFRWTLTTHVNFIGVSDSKTAHAVRVREVRSRKRVISKCQLFPLKICRPCK